MPEFAHPFFLLLLPVAALCAWAWLRQRRPAMHWPDVRPMIALPPGRAQRARWGGAILRGLGAAAVIVALSGPRWPDRGSRLPAEGIAIVVTLDVSGSMAESDFLWTGEPIPRLAAAQRAVKRFVLGDGSNLAGRPMDQVGLVAFAAQPDDTCPLTLSHDVLLKLLAAEEPRGVPDTGTNIGDALAWSLKKLEAAGNCRKVIVLVSDGEHNSPAPALTPRQAAQLAAQAGVPIYAVDAGPPAKSEDKPEDAAARRAGQQSLAAVAAMTGGRSFLAHDSAALTDALKEIDRLERAPAESFQYRRYFEAFSAFALTAFACFALVLGLEATVWRRTP
jgi:Ca-activated chloride channel family protein